MDKARKEAVKSLYGKFKNNIQVDIDVEILHTYSSKERELFVQHEGERFVPCYRAAADGERVDPKKFISNYGRIISFCRGITWTYGTAQRSNAKWYYITGSHDRVHRLVWFSFAQYEIMHGIQDGIALSNCCMIIPDLAALYQLDDERIYGSNRKYEIHHINSDSLDNRLENLQCLECGTHVYIDTASDLSSWHRMGEETEDEFNKRVLADELAATMKRREPDHRKAEIQALSHLHGDKNFMAMANDTGKQIVSLDQMQLEFAPTVNPTAQSILRAFMTGKTVHIQPIRAKK